MSNQGLTAGSPRHWSIGEVLSLLQDEFPEITISKIRFLESQGLISPERTPSGYRRFYQGDFDLLRWILVQQRDHYLPLKVIRDRILAGDVEIPESQLEGEVEGSGGDRTGTRDHGVTTAPAQSAEAVIDEIIAAANAKAEAAAQAKAAQDRAAEAAASRADRRGGANDGANDPTLNDTAANGHSESDTTRDEARLGDPRPDERPTGDADREDRDIEPGGAPEASRIATEPSSGPPLALTKDELAEAAGCAVATITDLEKYGLIKGRKAGPTILYDQLALTIARIAGQFNTFGLEPRHLRVFLIGAEREVGLVHQVVEPLLHRRDEETRRKAKETLEDLIDLAGSLRSILMRQASEELLPPH